MCDPTVEFSSKYEEAHDSYVNFRVQPKLGSAFDIDPDQPLPPAIGSQKAILLKRAVISLLDEIKKQFTRQKVCTGNLVQQISYLFGTFVVRGLKNDFHICMQQFWHTSCFEKRYRQETLCCLIMILLKYSYPRQAILLYI